jgi:hypothetical protein
VSEEIFCPGISLAIKKNVAVEIKIPATEETKLNL